MPAIGRGHRSSTYEILELISVDHDALSITVRHAAANAPTTLRLKPPTATAAAHQLLDAVAQSLAVAPDSDADSRWTSLETLEKAVWQSNVMLKALHAQQVETFAAPTLTVATLRELYAPFTSSAKRSVCWLLARTVRKHHPNGRNLAYVLKNSRFQVEDSTPFTYDEDTAAGIERAARKVFIDAYRDHRALFQTMGFDIRGRDWLRVPAEEVIAWAIKTSPTIQRDVVEPADATDSVLKLAWAITHPERFGRRKYGRGAEVRGAEMRRIGRALYPDNVTLVAAAIIHCLAEHAGYNLSVLMEKSADSLVRIGPNEALERSIKARGSREDTRATRLDSLFTAGGLSETLTGLTRLARHHRRVATDAEHPLNQRLYVEHVVDPREARVLASERIHQAWRHSDFDRAWSAEMGYADKPGLRLAALRLEAQRRSMRQGLTADVHGHSERTKVHYLAHVLPEHALHELATQAQDAFHDEAAGQFQHITEAAEGPAAQLAAIAPDRVMDVEIGLCTSGGNAPDSDRRCHLGMAACFTCPNGYRTVDHVPGLLAAVEFAGIVESNDPDEWANGDASDLRFYAQASLDQFPRAVVRNIAQTTDLTPHILTVTGMYMEMRHG
jgi:hypothetical protein